MASNRRLRRKSWTGKRRHLSVAHGQGHVAQLHRAKGYQGRLDVYRCGFCNGFHVGHSTGKR